MAAVLLYFHADQKILLYIATLVAEDLAAMLFFLIYNIKYTVFLICNILFSAIVTVKDVFQVLHAKNRGPLPRPEDSPRCRVTVPTCVAAAPWPLCPLSEDCCTPPPPARGKVRSFFSFLFYVAD